MTDIIEEPVQEEKKTLLIPEEAYLTSGVHIGTQQKSADMKQFLFKVRSDGLYVLDVKKTDERIRLAANLLSQYEPKDILVVSARQYGKKPAKLFAKTTGIKAIAGRFIPGSLTNYNLPNYAEPKAIFVTDPAADQQAIREAMKIGIPIVGLCDANNETRNMDLVIPSNNKGRRSLALVYWLLTREFLKRKGKITTDEDYLLTVDDFEATL
ncbi:MAG: 30S ribosomal protein S2 [Thermoplasmata archaeon]|nr:30S ribosomal protein S2 [Thermoplasmata archaeon]